MPKPYRIQIDEAVGAALEGATVATANTRAARNLLRQCSLRKRAGDGAWRTPVVLPLAALIDGLWRSAQIAGALDTMLLSDLQQQQLWATVIRQSPVADAFVNRNQFASLAANAWQAIHAYRIPLRSAAFRTTAESSSFLNWANAYADCLARARWTDSSTQIDRLLPVLEAVKQYLPGRMLLVGFDQLTPQQRELMEALSAQGVAVHELTADCGAAMQVRATRLPDGTAELTAAAGWARAHLEAEPSATIGVVVAGLSRMRDKVEQIFCDVLHPERRLATGGDARLAFDISLGQPLSHSPIVRPILTFVRLLSGAVSFADFSSWVRSPFFGAFGQRAQVRGQLDHFLVGRLGASVTLEAACGALEKANAAEFACAELIAAMRRAREFAGDQRPASPSRWIDAISKLIGASRWPGERDGLVLTSEEYQARESWEDLLAEIGSLDLVRPRMELREAVTFIAEGASAKIFKPRNQGAPIQVMGELEAAGSAFDRLWIAGWSDDQWPARSVANSLIPIALQREHDLPHSSAAGDFAFARAVTERLLQSAPEVIVSWPASDEDRELRPSRLLKAIPFLDSNELRVSVPEPWTDRFDSVSLECVQDYRSPAVGDGELHSSGTRIVELQSNCPFRAFVEYRLFAREQRSAEAGLAPMNRGKLVESALQFAWETLRDRFTLENCGESHLREIIADSIEQAFREVNLTPADTWERRCFELERTRLSDLIYEWLQFEKLRDDFRNLAHQQKCDLELGGLRLHGFIDRIDCLPDGSWVIIDYKTGQSSYTVSQWASPRPVRPQLPLYAVALLRQPPKPIISGVAFGLVNRRGCGLTGVSTRPQILGKKSSRVPPLEEFLQAWEPELERIAGDFTRGDARIAPKYPPGSGRSTCEESHCHLHAVCRVAEMAFSFERLEQEEDDAAE